MRIFLFFIFSFLLLTANCFAEKKPQEKVILPPEAAFARLESELSSNPYDLNVLKSYYSLAIQLGLPAKADAAIKTAYAVSKGSNDVLSDRIITLRMLGNYEEAAEIGLKILASEPANWRVYNNLALVYMSDGKYEKAIDSIEKAYAIQPADIRLQLNRVAVYAKSGYSKKSSLMANKILEYNPEYGPALNNEGALMYASGNIEGSDISLNEALLAPIPSRMAEVNIAVNLYNAGDYNAAFRKLVSLESERPADLFVKKSLSASMIALGRNQEAVAKIKEALDLSPDRADFMTLMGIALFNLEQFTQANEWFMKALWLEPENIAAKNNLGLCLKRQALYDRAALILNDALNQEPGNKDVCFNLAGVYEIKGDNTMAAKMYRRYLELSPDGEDREEVTERIRQLERNR